MKILGLISIMAMVVIGYCAYNSIVANPTDAVAEVTGTTSSGGCEGPFGVDSQKIFNKRGDTYAYQIGIVTEIDHGKNDDGTWYVKACQLYSNDSILQFATPYPQQNELKEGDFIGFSCKLKSIQTSQGKSISYRSGKILDYISLQSVKCKIDDITQLSTPSISSRDELLKDVTGVVMAVETQKNRNPEPDNPDDFQIGKFVMKCADGNLYQVQLNDKSDYWFFEVVYKYEADQEKLTIFKKLININLPSPDAFGEGDVVTVTQLLHTGDDQVIPAYYQKK